MPIKIATLSLACFALTAFPFHAAEVKTKEYKGVVTYQLLPAKVLKINQIIKDPKPGTSHIGDEGILVHVDENPKVVANWTVVTVQYYKYKQPKTITYEMLSEDKEINVEYHAVSLTIDGDLSTVISENN